jgi:hypothetical protein
MNDHHNFDQIHTLLSTAITDEPHSPPADLNLILRRGRRRKAVRKNAAVVATFIGTVAAAVVTITFVVKPSTSPPAHPSNDPLQAMQSPRSPDPEEARRLEGVLRTHPLLSNGATITNDEVPTNSVSVTTPSDPREDEYKAEGQLQTQLGKGYFMFLANEPGSQSTRPACNNVECNLQTTSDGTQLWTNKHEDSSSNLLVLEAMATRPDGSTVYVQIDNQLGSTATPPLTEDQLIQLVLTPELTPRK